MLIPEQISTFDEQGFLVVKKFADSEQIQTLKKRMDHLLSEMNMDHNAVFSTKDQEATSDVYFLESGDKVRCFFETVTPEKGHDQQERVEKHLKINKVGHALHELDPVFKEFSSQEAVFKIAQQLGQQQPSIIQSQYIFKSPKVGGDVSAHTDSTFLYTDPLSCLGYWIALDPATISNGCLWSLPGSHKDYPLQQRFIRNTTNDGTLFIQLEEKTKKWKMGTEVAHEVEPGDLVLLHGSNVHWSYPNESNHARNAYVLHLIDEACKYPKDNWLQR